MIMKKYLLVILISIASVVALAGCSDVGGDPSGEATATGMSITTISPTDVPEETMAVTEVPATEVVTPEVTPTEFVPTEPPTPTPEPTEEPTARPSVDDLKFVKVTEGENGTIRDLITFAEGSPEGYKEHVLANIFDHDDRTYWSYLNNDLNVELEMQFSVPVYIYRLDNWWYTLNKVYCYNASARLSGSEEVVLVKDRSANTTSDETQDNISVGPVESVKYSFFDNSMLNRWVQFAELYVIGFTVTSETYEIDHAKGVIRIPGETSQDEFMEGLTLMGSYKVSIGFLPDEKGTVSDSSVLRISYKDVTADFMIEYLRND